MEEGLFSGLDGDAINNLEEYNVVDDECVKMLIDKETRFGFKTDKTPSILISEEIRRARSEAIQWILKTRAVFRFGFLTVYLSVIYFDRFLSIRPIDSDKLWAFKLLSVACLSLAAKMEEIKIPSLPEYQIEEYNFENRVIQKMELLVLNTLDWRLRSVTPFAFLHYFMKEFCKDFSPSNILPRSVSVILSSIGEMNLMDHRPSSIAAATTLAVLDQRLTKQALESKMNSVSCCGFLEIEDVLACYNVMQRLVEMENSKRPDTATSPENSPSQLRTTTNVPESSSVGSKRRRLTFDKSDET